MHWVLVTGAGASTTLGQGRKIPLMPGWAETLKDQLDDAEKGLSGAVGLQPSMSGIEFEETLGAFLRWQDLRSLNRRFAGLTGPSAGSFLQPVQDAMNYGDKRVARIMKCINESLYDEFGAARVNGNAAADAYGSLLSLLPNLDRLTVVTTNYDSSAEIALSMVGWPPETGFERQPGRAPVLRPDGFVTRQLNSQARGAAVLHLHGAVGWYESGGSVLEHHQDQPFREALGRPVVLYPDPEKDPTRDALVNALWREFDEALASASAVLVLGHSLHDPALLERLREAAISKRVLVGVWADDVAKDRPQGDPHEVQRVLEVMQGQTTVIPMRFGPRALQDFRELRMCLAQFPTDGD